MLVYVTSRWYSSRDLPEEVQWELREGKRTPKLVIAKADGSKAKSFIYEDFTANPEKQGKH